ncbi:MAG: A/G-specific adenine glycosylase [Fibrobacterota bacterium]|jgi:A/G-specific adenine glycosylase
MPFPIEDDFPPAPKGLLDWFRAEGRELPWRDAPQGVRDPWRTLVSEVMSQQTRLEVVVPRFLEWMMAVPTPAHLAVLSEDAVLSMWAGLGYYNRARNLQALARRVTVDGWPETVTGLKALPGVGDYTAAAVASLCFRVRVPAVDGNVERVLSRIHSIEGDLRAGNGKRRVLAAAVQWVSEGNAGAFNEATMELGARVCTPRNPRCPECPCRHSCSACLTGTVEQFPRPRVRAGTVDLLAKVAVMRGPKGILLRRAGVDELLVGHWTLPRIGVDLAESVMDRMSLCGTVRHSITHHRIAWEIFEGEDALDLPDLTWVSEAELPRRIVSSLPRKALAKAGIRW